METNILVGIDFGTTNTVISVFENNKSKVLCDSVFKTIPSKIGFEQETGKIYCGNYIPINCNNIIHSFKITIGEDKVYSINNMTYTHSDLLIIFFQHIHSIILKNYNIDNPIIKAVITVPSNFNDMQRELIKSCFNSVSINVIRIINEPSAAALAYGLNHSTKENEKILVIDTGGGTMDFTILEKTELFFEVIHSEGLNDLGGNNFTEIIVNDIKNQQKNLEKNQQNDNILWNQAQKVKEKLTYLEFYEINNNYSLTRTRFENLSNILIKKVENVLTEIINNYPDLEYIILVGGTSRIPFIQRKIKEISNKTPWIHPNLESVVSEGAGLYCGIIENKFTINEDVVLMDVLPLSLGVELVDGTFSIIIPKNTPLPIKRSQKYTTDSPSEQSVRIKVYQGERKIASKNFLIGEIIFDKVTMGGVPVIEISFKVDLDSIIYVNIIDKKSGLEKSILIKDIPKIECEQVEKLIEQANKLADMDQDELTRCQNIYLIKTHIENSLANLEINTLLDSNTKEEMLNSFKTIEDNLNTMNNLQLIDTLNELQDKYSILGSAQINDTIEDDSIEQIIIQERKIELKNRIDILLVKNPDLSEYFNPVLEELSYSSCSSDYINEKLKLLDEIIALTSEDTKDYKKEVNNLCLYLKSEIELGNINMGDNNILLITLINENLEKCQNTEEINWKEQLELLNKKCEEIYQK